MPKLLMVGRGGSGKSTLTSLLAGVLSQRAKVLVVDADESNLGLSSMLGLDPPRTSLVGLLGGRKEVGKKLLASLQQRGAGEKVVILDGEFHLDSLPDDFAHWSGNIGHLCIGKVEHSNEGCACPMGAAARAFLKHLAVGRNEWVLVDTEAGVEHLGRGILEGVDAVLMVVEPSHEAVLSAAKARRMVAEKDKPYCAVINKADERTEAFLREELTKIGVPVVGVLGLSAATAQANLTGAPVMSEPFGGTVEKLAEDLEGFLVEN